MEFLQLTGILRDRWWIVIIGLVLGIAGGGIAYKVTDKQYKATTTVVADVKTPDPVAGIVQGSASSNYMSTLVEIIRSDRVAQRVVHSENLDKSSALIARWRDEAGNSMPFSLWLAKLLERGLEVLPARDSNVLSISFYSVDPDFSRRMAQAFAQAFIEVSVDMKVEPARQYAALFDEQTKLARDRVEAAKNRLHAYEQEKGVVGGSDRLEIETNRLTQLQSDLIAAEAQSVETRSRSANAGDTSPDVMQNGVVQGLRSEIDRAEAKLAELSAKVGKSNPSYIRAQTELTALKERLAQETRTVTTSVGTTGQVNAGKVAGLKAAIEAQRQLIFKMRQNLGDFAVLTQEVEAAQKFYDAVNQRRTQSTLESSANQTNIYLLSPASKPLEAVAPKFNKIMLAGTALGLAFGLGLAGLIELGQRKIRAVSELTDTLELNFLGELGAPAGTGFAARIVARVARRFGRPAPAALPF